MMYSNVIHNVRMCFQRFPCNAENSLVAEATETKNFICYPFLQSASLNTLLSLRAGLFVFQLHKSTSLQNV